MGMLDEFPNIANQEQAWANYYKNQNLWAAQRAAGAKAAQGDWAGASQEALSRGELGVNQDLETLHLHSQAQLAKKLLDVGLAAKDRGQWNQILDRLAQHGVPVSQYRIPADGDFETHRAATLSELGQYKTFLDAQKERQEKARFAYVGLMNVPGQRRTVAPQMPTPSEVVSGASAMPPSAEGPGALGSLLTATEGPAAGLGQETPQPTTEQQPDKNYMVFTNEKGEVAYRPIPEGATFEGKGGKKEDWRIQEANRLMEAAKARGEDVSDPAVQQKYWQIATGWKPSAGMQAVEAVTGPEGEKKLQAMRDIAAAKRAPERLSDTLQIANRIQEEARAAGKDVPGTLDIVRDIGNAKRGDPASVARLKLIAGPEGQKYLDAIHQEALATQMAKARPEAIQAAERIQSETPGMSFEDAYEQARGAGKQPASDIQLLQHFAEKHPDLPEDEVIRRIQSLRGRETEAERLRTTVKQEQAFQGVSPTLEAEKAIVGGRAEARLAGNPEWAETQKIAQESGVPFKEALAQRFTAATHPSREMQGLQMLQSKYPDAAPDDLLQKYTDLTTRKTAKDREIADILQAHPGETREDAMARATAANQLQPLTYDSATKTWAAHPISGTRDLAKLKAGNTSDLQRVHDSISADPRFTKLPDADRWAIARSVLNQKGYDVKIGDDGKLAYTVADNSAASLAEDKRDIQERIANIRQTEQDRKWDPQKRAEIAQAIDTAKYNVKNILGRHTQLNVVNSHLDLMNQLMGGEAPKTPEEKRQRALADSTLGFITRRGGINQIRGTLDPKNPMTPLAYQVHAVQTALQAEMSRLLSMGMTGQIAHAHAKELAQAVGELDELPTADAVTKQVKTIRGIIGAIQSLPMIPTDPLEAQKLVNDPTHRLNEGSAQPKITAGDALKALTGKDGTTHHYLKRVKPDGSGTEWFQTD